MNERPTASPRTEHRVARADHAGRPVELRVDEWEPHRADGRGAGEVPLVLVHGYTGEAGDFADVAPSLADGRRVVAYDHRGHGGSAKPGDPAAYTFDHLVSDLGAVLDRLDLPVIDLLGHSMGGVVALRYALDHPDRVRSLVLMDTAAEPAGRMPMEAIVVLAEVGRTQGMEAAWALARRFLPAGPDDDDPSFLRLDPVALVAFGHGLDGYPSLVPRLGEIACPTTVIVGEIDTGLRHAADVLAERIAGAELVVVTGAGHSPQVDDPTQWLAAVEGHLARVDR